MKILERLPAYTGEWIDVTDALPPSEARVWAAGSHRSYEEGIDTRTAEKAYWSSWADPVETVWFVSGPDSYRFEAVTHWMVLPDLPEDTGESRFTHQYTAETCPGRPCGEDCDHRGLPPRKA